MIQTEGSVPWRTPPQGPSNFVGSLRREKDMNQGHTERKSVCVCQKYNDIFPTFDRGILTIVRTSFTALMRDISVQIYLERSAILSRVNEAPVSFFAHTRRRVFSSCFGESFRTGRTAVRESLLDRQKCLQRMPRGRSSTLTSMNHEPLIRGAETSSRLAI